MREPMADSYQIYYYIGKSMKGTFQPADTLLVSPVDPAQLRAGDVVLFRDSRVEYLVVHRVRAVVRGGLIAQGDSSFPRDVDVVLDEDIIGKVAYRRRHGKLRPVRGGMVGSLRGRLLRTRRFVAWELERGVWYVVTPLARGMYRGVRMSGIVPRLWRPSIQTIHVITDEGPLVKYVHRNRTVAKWWLETNEFRCRRPYSLVLRSPVRK